MSECPVSAVPRSIWSVLDLFWLAHARIPGTQGWLIVRQGYPQRGAVMDQDNRLMWAFQVIQAEFASLQADLKADAVSARNLEAAHRKTQAAGQR